MNRLWLLVGLAWLLPLPPAHSMSLGPLTAISTIDFKGNNVIVDSFNSLDPNHSDWQTNMTFQGSNYGTYPTNPMSANPDGNYKRKANGNVATDGLIINVGNANIYGYVDTAPGGSVSVGAQSSVGDVDWVFNAMPGIQPGHALADMNIFFPDVGLPSVSWTTVGSGNGRNSVTISGPGYYQFQAQQTASVTIAATNVVIYFPYGFKGATLTINSNSNVKIYAANGFDTGNNVLNNSTKFAANCIIYGLPGCTTVNLGGNGNLTSILYAPEASLSLGGGGITYDAIGSFVAHDIAVNGHFNFHFDEALLAPSVTAPPVITSQPTNHVAIVGSNVTFTVSATGTTPISYEWYFNQTNWLAGGTGTNYSSLTLTNVQMTNAGIYSVMVSTPFSSVMSSNATLTVIAPPVITSQPTNLIVLAGSPAAFGVVATGTTPAYQWQFNGTNLPNGIITTVAGNGINGFSGDGGAATNAGLTAPSGLALDANGNLFFSDEYTNTRIRKVDANGIITTVAGNGMHDYSSDGGAATNTAISLPLGIAVNASGNLFIAEYGAARIRKMDENGIITTVAGNGTYGYSGDGGAATNAALSLPVGVVLDPAGNVFFSDSYTNNRIRKVDTNGIITTVAGNGSNGYSGDGGTATNASLGQPQGVALDASGNLFFVDFYNSRIRKVDTNGNITTVAGNGSNWFSGDGGPATNATMIYPKAVTLDANGNLFFSDSGNNRIRKVDANGIITTVAGNGPNYPDHSVFSGDGGAATNAALHSPAGVALDAGGNLFISDAGNYRIRRVSSSSTQQTYVTTTYSTNNAGNYSVVVANAAGMTVSSNAALTVVVPPTNLIQQVGSTAMFVVQTFGPEALNFQWQKNGTNLVDGGNVSGSASSQLTLANISTADAAGYQAVVSDATTSLTTASATLTVYTNAMPALSGFIYSGSNGFQFQVSGVPGWSYAVQTSTNLVDWISLMTNTSPFIFTDADANVFPLRFYRTVGGSN